MAMEGALRSSLAALLFLTLVVVLAASASASGVGDDAAAAAVEEVERQKQCHPRADEPYLLVAFHDKDGGEEIRLLSDQRRQRSKLISGVTAIANRSGHWFYSPGSKGGSGSGSGRRRRLVPRPTQPQSNNRFRAAEGLWNSLGVLVNATATATNHDDSELQAGYMLVDMETGGGDKNRLVLVADQRYFVITGHAQGFSSQPRWFFSERHRVLPLGAGNGSSSSSSSSSHAEVVAFSVLAALSNAGRSCGCG